jgi:tetratricopeptide (TPR) repeat protein
LAGLYDSQGRYEQAEPLMKEALEIRKQVLGTNHPDYAASLNNLAMLYYKQSRFDQAIPLIKQALSIWIKTLPREHPHISSAFNSLIQMLIEAGQLQPDQVEAAIPQLLLEIQQMEVDGN